MRGDDLQQHAMFSYLSPEQRVPQDHPLRKLRPLVDQVLQQLSPRLARMDARGGRPSIPPEKLLRDALNRSAVISMATERVAQSFASQKLCGFCSCPRKSRRVENAPSR